MNVMTFYDINYWNVAECLFDIFSIIFFIWILSVVLIIGFSKFTTFQAAKPLYYFTGFCVNVMITLVFTIFYAIIFNLIMSTILFVVYDKYDIPNMVKMASKGATGLSEYKVRKQMEEYDKLTKEEQNEISNKVPSAEKIKIGLFPWFLVTFVVPATVTLIIKLVVGY